MWYKFLSIACFMGTVMSCSEVSNTNESGNAKVNMSEEKKLEKTLQIQGSFYGKLFCQDFKKANVQFVLNSAYKFQLSEYNDGKTENKFNKAIGNWKYSDDMKYIELMTFADSTKPSEKIKSYEILSENELIPENIDKSDSTSRQYFLVKPK